MQEEMTGQAIAIVFQCVEGSITFLKSHLSFLELERQKANGAL